MDIDFPCYRSDDSFSWKFGKSTKIVGKMGFFAEKNEYSFMLFFENELIRPLVSNKMAKSMQIG